jgi:hypothetical protein
VGDHTPGGTTEGKKPVPKEGDAIIAFVKWSGLRLLEDEIVAILGTGRPLRGTRSQKVGVGGFAISSWSDTADS